MISMRPNNFKQRKKNFSRGSKMGSGKKRKPTSILFDESSRHEFLTGFHKRKLERRKKFEEKLEKELKEAKKQIKLEAREMTKKIINLNEEDHISPIFEKCYELPDHTVHVRELSTNAIAQENNWIGENKSRLNPDSESEHECDDGQSRSVDDALPGMALHSIKAVKKAICKQSLAMMQQNSVFKKKNRIERAKNKQNAKKQKIVRKKKKRGKRRK